MVSLLVLCILVIAGEVDVARGNHIPEKVEDSTMVLIPEGTFLRGSAQGDGRSDETPQTEIFVKSFHIDMFEATYGQYLNFLSQTGHREPFNVFGENSIFSQKGIMDLPVVQVTWNDAQDYCDWVGKRLPTEAEWEKAARGSDGRKYPWGNITPTSERANYDTEWGEGAALHSVGSHPSGVSPYGIHDMSGNIREWVSDWYSEDYYAHSPSRNPEGPQSGLLKVIRGGSWHSLNSDIRAAARGKGGFALKTHGVGFRCAKDAEK